MSNIVKFETDRGEVELSPQIIRDYFCRNANDQEVAMFLRLCQYQRLNPWLRQAHLVKYGTQPASLVVGWHVFLERAEANPHFDGYDVEVYDDDGKVYRGKSNIAYATAKVYRKDRKYPIVVTVMFDEYCLKNDQGQPRAAWGKIPGTMIRKVALEQALRESFTKEFQGLYGPEEMGVSDPETLPSKPIHVVAKEVPQNGVAEPPEPEDDEGVVEAAPQEVRPVLITPFAVVKYLADQYGGAWTQAKIDKKSITEHYFGKELKNTNDMAAFALADGERWQAGAQQIMEAAKRSKPKR